VDGALRELTPPRRDPGDQTWHTYEPVRVGSAERVLDLLERPRRWPEFMSELGRFTSVRKGGLLEQTFEIEVAARVTRRTPAFTRGYVTATRVLGPGVELDSYVEEIPIEVVPPDGGPLGLVELTTHDGHFLGRAVSRLLLFQHGKAEWLRDVGSWDPLPPHLQVGYHLGGKVAQHKMWGEGGPEESLLHQVALVSERRAVRGRA
jgi:hypothetical protein